MWWAEAGFIHSYLGTNDVAVHVQTWLQIGSYVRLCSLAASQHQSLSNEILLVGTSLRTIECHMPVNTSHRRCSFGLEQCKLLPFLILLLFFACAPAKWSTEKETWGQSVLLDTRARMIKILRFIFESIWCGRSNGICGRTHVKLLKVFAVFVFADFGKFRKVETKSLFRMAYHHRCHQHFTGLIWSCWSAAQWRMCTQFLAHPWPCVRSDTLKTNKWLYLIESRPMQHRHSVRIVCPAAIKCVTQRSTCALKYSSIT